MGSDVRLELAYPSAAVVARDRLPHFARGLLARTAAPVQVDAVVDVAIALQLERLEIRARGRVRWITPLATSALVGLELEGETPDDGARLDALLAAPAGGSGAAMTPTTTPALSFASAPVLSVAMLQPNPVLRQVLASALQKLTARRGERWTLKLEASAKPEGFLASMADRVRHLAIVDGDAVPGAEDALVAAIRSHDVYAKLPVVLLSGHRPARLEDRFAVTMQKPLAVKSFLHTTELLLRA